MAVSVSCVRSGADEEVLMDRVCYNCKKCFSPDRTCLSDGDCEWFEPAEGPYIGLVPIDGEPKRELDWCDVCQTYIYFVGGTERICPKCGKDIGKKA